MKNIGLILVLLFSCCIRSNGQDTTGNFLYNLLAGKDSMLDEVLNHPDLYEFQLIYATPQSSDNNAQWQQYSFHLDQSYFYPASLIKFPLMAIALEKMTALKKEGIDLTTPFSLLTCSCDKETETYVRKSKRPCIDQFMREMMIMSNNDAFNLFFDFVGFEHFNRRMLELNFQGICLKNRFVADCKGKNKFQGGFLFTKNDKVKYHIPCDSSVLNCQINPGLPYKAGRFHTENGKKMEGPKDYSASNFLRLKDAHDFMIKLFYPQADNRPDFLIDSNYKMAFLKSLGDVPNQLKNSNYQQLYKKPDNYYKFFMNPTSMKLEDQGLHIYNKVGMASGFLSDVSYFEDPKKQIRFFLSACIFSKKDGFVGKSPDNYSEFGIPVLQKIGEIIYAYEQKKDRSIR